MFSGISRFASFTKIGTVIEKVAGSDSAKSAPE